MLVFLENPFIPLFGKDQTENNLYINYLYFSFSAIRFRIGMASRIPIPFNARSYYIAGSRKYY